MGQHRHSQPDHTQLVPLFNELSLKALKHTSDPPQARENINETVDMNEMDWEPLDEGFHEEWPALRPSALMEAMSVDQSTVFIKKWLQRLPTCALADIAKCIWPRLHKDFVRDLPHELKYEVLSYLDIGDLVRATGVSLNWLQICSYPLLWKTLYFREGWTIAEEVMEEFEARLAQMQSRFNFHYTRLRSAASQNYPEINNHGDSGPILIPESTHTPLTELYRLYEEFFDMLQSTLDGNNTYLCTLQLRTMFSKIAQVEVGESFYRSAMFTPNSNGSIRVHVDWQYLYMNRNLLEDNWRGGCYQAELLDGAPDVSTPNQREGIYCVYFDRRYLAAGARDHNIRLWEMPTMKYQKSLHSHKGSVLCLQLDSKRNMLVSGSSDSTIKVWDIDRGEVVQTLIGHNESVLGLHFDDNYIVSCSKDNTARIWGLCDRTNLTGSVTDTSAPVSEDSLKEKPPRYTLLHVLAGHRAAVNSVHITANTIATASGDRSVRLWSLDTGAAIRTITAHGRGIACVSITGNLVITGSSDHVIRLFDISTGEEVRTLRGHSGLVRTIQADDTKIISGSYDQSIRIWDLKTGEMLQELGRCHDSKCHP